MQFIILIILKMPKPVQIVMSLKKLTLPCSERIQRVHLRLRTGSQEVSCQSSKTVRNGKVNFYRENLTLQYWGGPIEFLLFDLTRSPSTLHPTLTLETQEAQLNNIGTNRTSCEINQDGFSLTYDAWIYSDVSSAFNNATVRDYEELEPQSGNQQGHQLLTILKTANQVQFKSHRKMKKVASRLIKRSSSSDQMSSTMSDRPRNKPEELLKADLRKTAPMRRPSLPHKSTYSQDLQTPSRYPKKRGQIKKQIYIRIASKMASFFHN